MIKKSVYMCDKGNTTSCMTEGGQFLNGGNASSVL